MPLKNVKEPENWIIKAEETPDSLVVTIRPECPPKLEKALRSYLRREYGAAAKARRVPSGVAPRRFRRKPA